jgi:invasion protein IalB
MLGKYGAELPVPELGMDVRMRSGKATGWTSLFVFGLAMALGSIGSASADAKAEVKQEKYDDWLRICVVEKQQEARCQLVQKLVDQKQRKIIVYTVRKTKAGAYLDLNAPLGLSIPSGIKIQVDDKKSRAAQLVDCNKDGCRAVIPIDAALAAEMKSGTLINTQFTDSKSGKSVVVAGSLKGFGAAAAKHGL